MNRDRSVRRLYCYGVDRDWIVPVRWGLAGSGVEVIASGPLPTGSGVLEKPLDGVMLWQVDTATAAAAARCFTALHERHPAAWIAVCTGDSQVAWGLRELGVPLVITRLRHMDRLVRFVRRCEPAPEARPRGNWDRVVARMPWRSSAS